MRKLNAIFLFTAFFFSCTLTAQNKEERKKFKADSLEIVRVRLVRPQLKFDSRSIFLPHKISNVSGFDVGVLLKEKLRLTFGFYTASTKNIDFELGTYSSENFSNLYSLKYGSINMEFIYKRSRFYSLGMPFEFGLGSNYIHVIARATNINVYEKRGGIGMCYFGLSGTFTPIRWFGLKASVGYRKILVNQVPEVNMSGFYTSIGLAIDFREIIKDVQMFRLKKHYYKNFKPVEAGVDIITD